MDSLAHPYQLQEVSAIMVDLKKKNAEQVAIAAILSRSDKSVL